MLEPDADQVVCSGGPAVVWEEIGDHCDSSRGLEHLTFVNDAGLAKMQDMPGPWFDFQTVEL